MLSNTYKRIFQRALEKESKVNLHILEDSELVKLFFNEAFYYENYKDVAEAGVDAYEHYINYGWKELRDPSPSFSTSYYLLEHEDVNNSNVNPLVHYALWGRNEKRKIKDSNLISRPIDIPSGLYEDNYFSQYSTASGGRSPFYAPLMQRDVSTSDIDTKFISFYLPQFHPFAENDNWWGKGFTEWTNVSKAVPQFKDHYQPRLPGELGFYDLRLISNMRRQVELAKKYGISAFCFHYYWFDGKRLMEEPIENYLNDKSIDFPFCLCWANENWTRRWDGAEHDVLIGQNHSHDDNIAVFYDFLRHFNDERYVTVEGKPLIVIYRPAIIPNIKELVATWRRLAQENGLSGLHIVATNAFGFTDFSSIDFDAIVEFPPHGVVASNINDSLELLNSNYKGNVYDYTKTVDFCLNRLNNDIPDNIAKNYYPCVMTGWDNEARKPGNGNVFHNATPLEFNRWLKDAEQWARNKHKQKNSFVFINAWNEWAEGTYLEPDRQFGYAYLNAVSNVREHSKSSILDDICNQNNKASGKINNNALYYHIFYEDMIDEISLNITKIKKEHDIDVIVSVPSLWKKDNLSYLIKKINPNYIFSFENKGRDILPFFLSMKNIEALGYKWICKLHSKKSLHLSNGDAWRKSIFSSLTSPEIFSYILNPSLDSKIGLIAHENMLYRTDDPSTMAHTLDKCMNVLNKKSLSLTDFFIGGTMFWVKSDAILNAINNFDLLDIEYEEDLGAIDGSYAHAMERLIPTLIISEGYEFTFINGGSSESITPYK
ncbi:glycoside hydrolase family 99-like domain-containing protein [Aeromonas media]|uniref:glycoside hydrolase family 99-like domain-containing protein n=1 Tax=Aeromonas media TaxID=651 RepID=UPI003D1DBD37